ncbi:MAG: translation initiation factor IF-2 [Candidatus Vogelbacteria bacterium]|nr:translation initiation factor IF-2 [Candidatus Vogelbacteria bacterium]
MTKSAPKTEVATKRPPVVVIMGHVDHGKSTLLDYIRKTNVVASESGGITQHISAYEVKHQTAEGKEELITFLDTPGHEAFELMRTRGAFISDIAVLIVSAEEGVKAQTMEAIKSIKAANIPYLVAINKIDRPGANPEHVRQELAEKEVYVESYGGQIPAAEISAKVGTGVNELLDLILLSADLTDLTGNKNSNATGFVLETHMDPKNGGTATLVIKNGTLNLGDFVVAGSTVTKLKKIENYNGVMGKNFTFSAPVKAFGFSELPPVGATFASFGDKKEAEVAMVANKQTPTVRQLADNTNSETATIIPVILKADVTGSLEALEKAVRAQASGNVEIKILATGIGAINDNDIKSASASDQSLVLGFRVKIEKGAKDLAKRFNLIVETFDIIYKLTERLAELVVARTPRVLVEETVGKAKILKLFGKTKDRQIAGGQVLSGKILRGREVKILRRDFEIGRGRIVELEQQKTKTAEVAEGNQFGSMIESRIALAMGDTIEVFDNVEKVAE